MLMRKMIEAVNKEPNYGVEVVQKNNRVLHGVVLKDKNPSPCFYLEDFVHCKSETDLLEQLSEAFMSSPDIGTAVDLMDYEKAKKSLFIRMYGLEGNESLVEKSVHYMVADMAAVVCMRVDAPGRIGSAVVRQDLLKLFDVDENTVIGDALDNNDSDEVGITSMGEMLGIGDTGDGLMVIHNKSGVYGASAILRRDIREKLLKKFPEGCYILPSSIHEVLALPFGMSDVIALKDMVTQINDTEVSPDDRLTYSVYQLMVDSNIKKVA